MCVCGCVKASIRVVFFTSRDRRQPWFIFPAYSTSAIRYYTKHSTTPGGCTQVTLSLCVLSSKPFTSPSFISGPPFSQTNFFFIDLECSAKVSRHQHGRLWPSRTKQTERPFLLRRSLWQRATPDLLILGIFIATDTHAHVCVCVRATETSQTDNRHNRTGQSAREKHNKALPSVCRLFP